MWKLPPVGHSFHQLNQSQLHRKATNHTEFVLRLKTK
jgi:hypothetical protein